MKKSKIKIVILCGGKGTRLGPATDINPKPMVKIDKDPIILHILNYYSKFGYGNFILATGYKGHVIENFFKKRKNNFKVKCINTGLKTLTGGRLLRLKKYLKNEEYFMLTYGDGLTDQNLKKLEQYHLKKNKIGTMTTVRPPVRFGEVKVSRNLITKFKEKPQITQSWINGGFFVFNNKIFNFLKSDNEMLESRPLEKLVEAKQLSAFKHKGFWQCMDTQRDREYLQKLIKKNKALWKK